MSFIFHASLITDSVSTVENTSPIGEDPDGSEVTSLAPVPNDKPDDKKKSNASLTGTAMIIAGSVLVILHTMDVVNSLFQSDWNKISNSNNTADDQ